MGDKFSRDCKNINFHTLYYTNIVHIINIKIYNIINTDFIQKEFINGKRLYSLLNKLSNKFINN